MRVLIRHLCFIGVWWGSHNKHHEDTCSKEIEVSLQISSTTSYSIMYAIGRTCVERYWNLNIQLTIEPSEQGPGRLSGITDGDPSVSQVQRLTLTTFGFSLLKSRYILYILLKWSVILLELCISTGSSVTNCRFSPVHCFSFNSGNKWLRLQLVHQFNVDVI